MLPAGVIYLVLLLVVGGVVGQVSSTLAGILMFGVIFGFLYAMPGLTTRYAVTRSVSETYMDTGALFSLVGSRTYAVGVAKYLVLSIGLMFVYLVSLITIVGPLLVAPYMLYVRHSYWGAVYRAASDRSS